MSLKLTVNSDLILRFRQGDAKAFKLVYDCYYRKIYQYAYSYLKNKEQSEEILQETFLHVWINREKLNEALPITPLLFTICRRLVLDAFRKTARVNNLKTKLIKMNSDMDNHTEEVIMLSDLKEFAARSIDELPNQQQMVFKLSRTEDMSYDEIAAHLNISKHTVKNHLVIALKKLRLQFEEQGIVYLLLLFWTFQ